LRLDPASSAAPRAIPIMKDRAESCDVETFEVESAPGVFLPAFLFVPRPATHPVLRPHSAVAVAIDAR
jgi:hypothetical protein